MEFRVVFKNSLYIADRVFTIACENLSACKLMAERNIILINTNIDIYQNNVIVASYSCERWEK